MLHRLAAVIGAWFLASIPAALIIGAAIRVGAGADRTAPEPPEPPEGAMVPSAPKPAPAPVAAAA